MGASAAQAATPKEGRWTFKIVDSPVPSGPTGTFGVAKKGKKLVVTALNAPKHFVKCIGEKAQPTEMNPGFPHSWGGGEEPKVRKKGKFSYSRSFKSGTTTSRYSLSGQVHIVGEGLRGLARRGSRAIPSARAIRAS